MHKASGADSKGSFAVIARFLPFFGEGVSRPQGEREGSGQSGLLARFFECFECLLRVDDLGKDDGWAVRVGRKNDVHWQIPPTVTAEIGSDGRVSFGSVGFYENDVEFGKLG